MLNDGTAAEPSGGNTVSSAVILSEDARPSEGPYDRSNIEEPSDLSELPFPFDGDEGGGEVGLNHRRIRNQARCSLIL